MSEFTPEQRRQFAGLVAQAWSDEALATRYLVEPAAVLAEYGLPTDGPVPALPVRPDLEISDEELSSVSAAAFSTCGTISSVSCPAGTVGTAGSGESCVQL